jgi:curli biogenesis system outer membrane secretion channel CsgG
MRFRLSVVAVLLVTVCAAGAAAAQEAPPAGTAASMAPEAVRPTIAIAAFETDRTGWVPPPHFGETVADLLASRLVDLGAFRVFDRAVLPESEPHARASFDAIREFARQAGADFVLLGAVTRFANERKSRRGGLLGIPFIGGGGKSSQESSVGLTIRVVNARTGEIVTTASSTGTASKSSRTVGGGAVVHGLPVGGLFSNTSAGSLDRLVGDALIAAVDDAASALAKAAVRIAGDGRARSRPAGAGNPAASAASFHPAAPGRRHGAGTDEADPLLDRFMPDCDVVERHHVRVAAPAHLTLSAAADMDLQAVGRRPRDVQNPGARAGRGAGCGRTAARAAGPGPVTRLGCARRRARP